MTSKLFFSHTYTNMHDVIAHIYTRKIRQMAFLLWGGKKWKKKKSKRARREEGKGERERDQSEEGESRKRGRR